VVNYGPPKPSPLHIELGLTFWWDVATLWEADLPVVAMPIAELEWLLNMPFWDKGSRGDLEVARDALQKLVADRTIRFRVISDRPSDWLDTEFVPWSLADEVSQLGTCDIGIMPLVDNERTRGRCGYKAVQYQAAGLPVIASPVGGAQEVVQHEISGILANTETEWAAALDAVARSASLRARLGQAGRRNVEQHHSIERNARRLAAMCGP
jgi:glycosyltransferase involved in cell wall biosynthesis